jgi:lipopolysaccharide export LptBFGC system permease protein LptF
MKPKTDKTSIVCALLGFLGATVSLVMGFYLLSTMMNLASIQDETSQIWIAGSATAIAAITVAYGSCTILGNNRQKGGKINIVGGAVLILTYAYFSEFSQPKLLEWLNPIGIALLIPPIFSGAIGLISDSKNQSK